MLISYVREKRKKPQNLLSMHEEENFKNNLSYGVYLDDILLQTLLVFH